jgi:hypothetical protein
MTRRASASASSREPIKTVAIFSAANRSVASRTAANRTKANRAVANRTVAVIVGAGFLALGVLGAVWVAADETSIVTTEGSMLFGLVEVNGLQNILHLVLGLSLVSAGIIGLTAARIANLIAGTLLLVLGLVALFTIGSDANLFAINGWGNVVHLGASALLLGASLGADRANPQPASA